MQELDHDQPADGPASTSTSAAAPAVELRILSGLQAGARLALEPGDYRLGTSHDCDVILIGHGIAALAVVLTLHADGWSVQSPEEEVLRAFEFGQLTALSEVGISVDHENAPWPMAQAVGLMAASSDAARLAALAAAADAPGLAVPMAGPEHDLGPLDVPRTGARLRATVALGLGIAFSAVALTAAARLLLSVEPSSAAPPTLLSTEPSAASLAAQLTQLDFASGLKVTSGREAGTFIVHGYVPKVADGERLNAHLARWRGRVSTQVHIDEAIRERVLLELGAAFAAATVQVDNGVIQLRSGAAADGDAMSARLRAAGLDFRAVVMLPETPLASAARAPKDKPPAHGGAPSEALGRLRTLLREAGLAGKAHAVLESGVIKVGGDLTADELRAAQGVFVRFGQETQGGMEFIANFKSPEHRDLPFRVVQVVGGADPYVVTDRNERIYVGGEHRGYHLLSLKDGKIAFGGPNAVELQW